MSETAIYGGGVVAALAVAVAVAGWAYKPTPAIPTKPIPKVAPMDMRRFFEEGAYRQQGTDLHSLGKAGPAHDAWILKHYAPKTAPSIEPPKPAAPPRAPARVPARQPGAREA